MPVNAGDVVYRAAYVRAAWSTPDEPSGLVVHEHQVLHAGPKEIKLAKGGHSFERIDRTVVEEHMLTKTAAIQHFLVRREKEAARLRAQLAEADRDVEAAKTALREYA